MGDWTDKQKVGFILCQDVLHDIGLSNIEVAKMFCTFDDKETVFALFQFTTGRWLNNSKIGHKVKNYRGKYNFELE